jgi:hypothetical protein
VTLYFVALALTIVVETLVALVALPGWGRRLVVDVPLASLLTHPLATFAVHELDVPLLVAEVGVVLAEAAVYVVVTRLDVRRALLLSIVTNGVTTAIAVVWNAL